MKKFIIAGALLLTLVIVPQSAHAQTIDELWALIRSLQAQVAQLTALLEARNSGVPVITGLTAPTNLKVGEVGTWVVKAYDPEGQPLNYSANWGDTSYLKDISQQTATFTHSFSRAGTYTVAFAVLDDKDNVARTSATVTVGDGYVGEGYVQATSTGSTMEFSIDDDYGNGQLTAIHTINIRAVGKDAYIPNFAPFRHAFFLNGEIGYRSNANNSWIMNVLDSSRTVECPGVGGDCYRIPAGTNKNFRMAYQWDTRQLFGGVYYHQIIGVQYLNMGSSQYQVATVYGATTNKIYVVGEKSPYISSVTTPVKAGAVVTIKGSRLCNTDSVLLNGSTNYIGPLTCSSGYYADSDVMTFALNEKAPTGSYRLELNSKIYGKSNVKYIEVSGGTVTNPTITVTSPNGGETLVFGEKSQIRWQYGNGSPDHSISTYLVANTGTPYLIEQVTTRTEIDGGMNSWQVGHIASGDKIEFSQYKIRVCIDTSSTVTDRCDDSDKYFTIAPPRIVEPMRITVASPNGGENWQVGSRQYIRWSTTGTNGTERVRIRLVDPLGDERKLISSDLPNTGLAAWTVGNYELGTVGVGRYNIKICIKGTTGTDAVCDRGDARFTITDVTAATRVQMAAVLQSVQTIINSLFGIGS